jgi:choice-of-anchor B domain-containing protein
MRIHALLSTLAVLFLTTACSDGDPFAYRVPECRDSLPTPLTGPLWFPSTIPAAACVNGLAGEYPCSNVDLASGLAFHAEGSDIWGWTDPQDGTEYALVGLRNGTAFVSLADPAAPVLVGYMETRTDESYARDIKIYGNYAYVVSEANYHGLQVFDLTRLRGAAPNTAFVPDGVYTGIGYAHNIVINEQTGFAYAVGTSTCAGGLHMIDLTVPVAPTFAGCYSADGYTNDAQCVVYVGPDVDYVNQEICFAGNGDTLTIVDVTDKQSPVLISRTDYPGRGFVHQGWLTDDDMYFFQDDERDERRFGHGTITRVWDMSDLDAPVIILERESTSPAIDHNQYVMGTRVYQANYRSGMRILEMGDLTLGELDEVGFFDTYPDNDRPEYSGAWGVYPYFASGTVVTSDTCGVLYVLTPNLP